MTTSDFPTIVIEISFGGASGGTSLVFNDATRGKFDTGTFGTIGFTDVSSYGREFTTSFGRSRALEDYGAGRISTVLTNTDNRFDPSNLSGPYVTAGVTQVRPMSPMRISAIYNGTSYPIGYGYVDSVTTSYPGMGTDAIAVFQATDGFKVLNHFEPAGPSTPAGASEDAGARVTRVLNNAAWSNTLRDLDTGDSTVQETPLALNALSEIQGVVQSEQGYFFQAPDGRMTFRNRQTRITATRSTVAQAAWGNTSTLLRYTDIALAYDDLLVKNTISAQVNGGVLQEVADSASVGSYLTQSHNSTNLWLETDIDALNFANWMLWRYKDAELRVDSITVKPRQNPAGLWPIVLDARIGDLHTIAHTTQAGTVVNRSVFVEGIDHKVVAKDNSWETTFRYSSATNETSGTWLVFDNATSGKFNTGQLAPL